MAVVPGAVVLVVGALPLAAGAVGGAHARSPAAASGTTAAEARVRAATRTAVSSSGCSRALTLARPWVWVEMSPAACRIAR